MAATEAHTEVGPARLAAGKPVPAGSTEGAAGPGVESRDRFHRLETRMDGLETRMDGLETRMDGLDARMGRLETRMDGLEVRVHEVRLEVEKVRVEMANLGTELRAEMREDFADLKRSMHRWMAFGLSAMTLLIALVALIG